MSVSGWDSAYRDTPAWDIGRPQPSIVHLGETGQVVGTVLDIGCGTGEHALYFAERGLAATGIDGASTAISKARAKAKQRGLDVSFEVADALKLDMSGRQFDTVIDCGLFHVFSDEERPLYEKSLAGIVRPGGTCFLLCFSDRQPGDWGPRRVTQDEIRSAFSDGWRINYIEPATLKTNFVDAHGWLASVSSSRDFPRRSRRARTGLPPAASESRGSALSPY